MPNPTFVPRKCACGCGGTPRMAKSRYMPGHDARALHRVVERVRVLSGGSRHSAIELIDRWIGQIWSANGGQVSRRAEVDPAQPEIVHADPPSLTL